MRRLAFRVISGTAVAGCAAGLVFAGPPIPPAEGGTGQHVVPVRSAGASGWAR